MGRLRSACALAFAALVLVPSGAHAKATAAQSCESAKERAAGRASQCLLAAAATFASSAGTPSDIDRRDAEDAKCRSKMSDAYAKADAKVGAGCAVADNTAAVDAAAVGYAAEVVQLNRQPRFVDNGDGTVTDNATHLQWERKTGTPAGPGDPLSRTPSGPHDVNAVYSWSTADAAPWAFDGTAAVVFLAYLNAECFAGHCDWRLPTREELLGIIDPTSSPMIPSAFGPTASAYYWSSTAFELPAMAWMVNFAGGFDERDTKTYELSVRAVRGVS